MKNEKYGDISKILLLKYGGGNKYIMQNAQESCLCKNIMVLVMNLKHMYVLI